VTIDTEKMCKGGCGHALRQGERGYHEGCYAFPVEPEQLSVCPQHGEQKVVGYGEVGKVDPYGTEELACGHEVVCMGPGEPNVILGDPTKGDA
jgi:hypothetical protein